MTHRFWHGVLFVIGFVLVGSGRSEASPLTVQSATLLLTAMSPNGDSVQDATALILSVDVTTPISPFMVRATWKIRPEGERVDESTLTLVHQLTLAPADSGGTLRITLTLPWEGSLPGGMGCPDGVYPSLGSVELLTSTGTCLATCGFTLPMLRVDTVAPVVSLVSPADGALLGSATPLVNASHGEPKFSVTRSYRVDGVLVSALQLSEGDHTLQVGIRDTAGNTGWSAIHQVEVDLTPPVLTVLTPQSSQRVWAAVWVSGTASDPHLQRVEVEGGEANLQSGAFLHALTLGTGTQSVRVTARDQVGHTTSRTLAVTVDPLPSGPAVVGTVIFRDGTPLANLKVSLQAPVGYTATTDAWGRFHFPNIGPWSGGPFPLWVNPAPGGASLYTRATAPVTLVGFGCAPTPPVALVQRGGSWRLTAATSVCLTPDWPGLQLTVPAGSARLANGMVATSLTWKIWEPQVEPVFGLSLLHRPARVLELGPAGVTFDPPVSLLWAHVEGWAVGTRVPIWGPLPSLTDSELGTIGQKTKFLIPQTGVLTTLTVQAGGQGLTAMNPWLARAGKYYVLPHALPLQLAGSAVEPFEDVPRAHAVQVGPVEIVSQTGILHYRYALPAIQTFGRAWGPVFEYSSEAAARVPLATASVVLQAGAPPPDAVSVDLRWPTPSGGWTGSGPQFVSTAHLDPAHAHTLQVTVPAYPGNFVTGRLPIYVTLAAHHGPSHVQSVQVGKLWWNNLSSGPQTSHPFGRGVALQGLQSVSLDASVNPNAPDLIVREGAATLLRFQDQSGFGSGPWRLTDSPNTPRLVGADDPVSEIARFTFQGETFYTRTDATYTITNFDAQGRMVDQVDRTGLGLTLTYDPEGRVATVTYPGNAVWTFTYDGTSIGVTDVPLNEWGSPAPRGTGLQLDELGRLVTLTNPEGQTTTLDYILEEGNPNLIRRVIAPDGVSARVHYNSLCRVTFVALDRHIDPLAQTTLRSEWVWEHLAVEGGEAPPYATTLKEPSGARTVWSFDRFGQLTSERDALTHATFSDRDPQGNVYAVHFPDGGEAMLEHDERGNLLRLAEKLNDVEWAETTFQYDETFSQVTLITDPAQQITQIALDDQGNPERITDPVLGVTRLAYHPGGWLNPPVGGLVTQITTETPSQAVLEQTNFEYDGDNPDLPFGRITRITRPGGSDTALTYDAAGRLLQVVAGATPTFYRWDQLNRLTLMTHNPYIQFFMPGDSWTLGYNGQGSVVGVRDARAHLWTQAVDGLERVTLQQNEIGEERRYQYDPAGDLTLVHRPALGSAGRMTLMYDAAHRVIQKGWPGSGGVPATVQNYQYDPLGRLTLHNRTENGVLRHQEASQFDLGGRVTEVITTIPGSPTLTLTQAYTYSVRGERLTHTVNGTLISTNTFDELSRLISQHDLPSGVCTTLAYDAAGRRTLQAQRDPFASGAGTLTSAMSYNAAGQRLTLTREFLHPTGSSLVTEVANYDGAGRVVAVGDPFWPTTYTYDPLGRLTAVGDLSDPDEDAAYGFDPTGNLVSSRVGVGAPTHTWSPADAGNRLGLRTSSPLEVVYDPAGRLINFDPTGVRRTVFTYSPQDELLTVTPIEGTPVTRRYDALGRVYEENTVRKVYDGAQVLFDGEVRRRWGGLDEPWGTVDSTLAVTHQSVNFLGHGQDDVGAFGEYSGFASAAGFQGRPSVGALNDVQNLRLWDHRARVYSPELKRFLTEDPHGLWGMNQYSYGGNDPVNFRDPDGLSATAVGTGAGLLFGGPPGAALGAAAGVALDTAAFVSAIYLGYQASKALERAMTVPPRAVDLVKREGAAEQGSPGDQTNQPNATRKRGAPTGKAVSGEKPGDQASDQAKGIGKRQTQLRKKGEGHKIEHINDSTQREKNINRLIRKSSDVKDFYD